MKRLYVATLSMLLAFLWIVPAALAADPTPTTPSTGRVLISTGGAFTMPAGDQADFVFVTKGSATIGGVVKTLLVIDSTAVLDGAQVERIFAIRSPITLGAGTVVTGDIRTLDSPVTQGTGSQVQGSVSDFGLDLAGIGLILAPAIFLLWIGFILATIVAGLVLAALGARQVRTAESLISHEPGHTLVWGVGGVVLPLFLIVLLLISVVGAPIGLALLFGVWPLAAFLGYLVAGIWIGDWILHRTSPNVVRERPYLAAVVGILVLQVLTIIPFVTGIASLFGFGAVLLLAWRTFHQGHVGEAAVSHPATPAPMAS
jgi:hypothetical protein